MAAEPLDSETIMTYTQLSLTLIFMGQGIVPKAFFFVPWMAGDRLESEFITACKECKRAP